MGMRREPWFAAAAAVMLLISGCLSSTSEPDAQTNDQSSSTIIVQGEGGEDLEVPVTNETGAIVGEVLTDAGFGLPGARVTVFGAPSSAETNATGWFRILDVPPGKRSVRAEADHYLPAESEVVVEAGAVKRLTITLVPVEAEAGYRPHAHDDWSGRTEVQVIDDDFEWYRQTSAGPYGPVGRFLSTVDGTAIQTNCVSGSNSEIVTPNASPFHFDDPAQTVWPGTASLEISVRWTSADYAGGDTIGLAWRPSNTTSFSWGPPLKSGETYRISVQPPMWDAAHQPFTLWQFYACLTGKGQTSPVMGSTTTGRAFLGEYHVSMKMIRGYPTLVDPPHPRFWTNGSVISVLHAQKNVSCLSAVSFCYGAAVTGRHAYSHLFVWSPGPGALVPPGTSVIRAILNWSYDPPLSSQGLSLTYSTANVPTHEKSLVARFQGQPHVDSSDRGRTYEFEVQPAETDGFYQGRSNWAFAWNLEGSEADDGYIHECACTIRLTVQVYAVRATDPDM